MAWRRIATAVLAAFAATTAVPGPGVVAHRHAGGDHEHVHAMLFFGGVHRHHDDRHAGHDRAEAAHARRHRGHAHRPRVANATREPLDHVHVASPFQPATPATPPAVVASGIVTRAAPAAPHAAFVRATAASRSRGPPPSPRA